MFDNAEMYSCACMWVGERSGVFVLGLPIVVIGVSFDEAFKEMDKFKLEQALARAAKR